MKPASIFSLTFLALIAQTAQAQALNFFNNWFLTGDYASAGVGLANQGGLGTINMTGVPCTAGTGPAGGIVPCTTAGAAPAYPVAAFLYWETVENAAAPAAANGLFNGYPIVGKPIGTDSKSACWLPGTASQTLRVYRADVLRDLLIDPASHIRIANGAHPVALGQGVMGNSGVLATEGASLVVIYRLTVPGKPLLVPLRSVVIYDGVFTMTNSQPLMALTVSGFYQSSLTNPAGTMTQIVGNGQPGFKAQLKVHDASPPAIGNQPFVGAQGPNWDNLTFPISMATNAPSVDTTVTEVGGASVCMSWSTVVTSAYVQDSDNDGLLDIWEQAGLHRNTQVSPATFGTCADYPAEPCENLPAMGAKNGVQDIFLQLDWMHGNGDGTGGTNGNGYHSHMPSLDALTMVANAFAAHNIAIHFDVGNNYQAAGLPFIVPYSSNSKILAQGGSDLDESSLVCQPALGHCDYSVPYPVLSFKFGLASVRDGNSYLNIPRHLATDRKDTHHYALFAHALAGPYGPNGQPLDTNPKSTSGIGDRPGSDLLITLGLWRSDVPAFDQAGSTLVQAGTLMHELGHNLNLSHGGLSSTPNCMPDYPSVMSYMYQTRGLTDAGGVEHIDYSSGLLAGLNESSLSQANALGALQYRIRYYGPLNLSKNSPGQVAKAHCDGTPITSDTPLVRLEGSTLSVPDWSNGTSAAGTAIPLDVNFDGIQGEIFADQPDWSSLNLLQVGSRPGFGSLSAGVSATDAGISATDAGISATDAGISATDAGISATDAGISATDAGVSATDAGQDEDYDTHNKTTTDAIPTAQQCAGCGLMAANTINSIQLSWTPPGTGGSLTYNIYRCAGAGCDPTANPVANQISAGYVPPVSSAPTFNDTVQYSGANDFSTACSTCYNTVYTYSVTAVPQGGSESPYSTTAASEITHLFVIADKQAVVYGSPNPAPTFKIYGDVAGALTSGVSCIYSPTAPRNAGNYPIVCSGPTAGTLATDGVTYNAPYLTYTPGSLTISPRPITVTAGASTKQYDATTSSPGVPTITSGSAAYSDTPAFSETYDNPNVGATHVMTPTGSMNDQNGGKNYNVTFASINTGIITAAPLTITAATNTKPYDTMTGAAATPTVSGLQGSDTVTGLAETYDNASVGTGKTLSVSTYTVNDGNNGANYKVTLVANNTGVITKALLTASITASDKTYDTTTKATISKCSLTGILGTDVVTCTGSPATFASANASPAPQTVTAAINLGGLNASNYSVTSPAFTTAKINPAPLTISAVPTPVTKVYGDPLPAFSVTYAGFVGGETAAVLTGALGFTTSATATSPVPGPYLIMPSGLSSTNYAITFVPAVLNVVKATPAFSNLSSPTILYGTASVTVSGTISYVPPAGPAVFPTGSVSVTLNGVTQPALISATGTFSTTFTTTGSLSLGTYPIAYAYTGEPNFNAAANGAGTLKVAGFQPTGPMATARSFQTATLLGNGKVLVAGGISSSGQPLASSELYDPLAGTFGPTANAMPNKAAGHTATLLPNGKVLVVGGGNSSSQIFDPSTNLWSAGGGSGQRTNHTATLLPNGKVLIAGGSSNNGSTTPSAQLYDSTTGSFTATGNMNIAREFHTATLLANGKVLIAGGRTSSGNSYTYSTSAELYDPATGLFTVIANPMTARYGHTAALLGNGLVLLAGGGNGVSALSSAQLFDATTNTFAAAASLAAARQYFTATVIGGVVVEAGGLNGSTRLQSAEEYVNSAFTPGGNMTGPRAAHTATLLNNGLVVIIGGQNSSGTSTATADLYLAP
jgi:MBG domain-containing protein/YDG domain-containing protein/galactose oxidase-like protein